VFVQNFLGWLGSKYLRHLGGHIYADREFIVCGEQHLTRREIFDQVDHLAYGLRRLGLIKGDRVATLLPACPEAVVALLLPWALGNIEVPLNPLLREYEVRNILQDCQARAVITTQRWFGHDYPAMLESILTDLPDLEWIIVAGAGEAVKVESTGVHFLPLEEVLALGSGRSRGRFSISPREIGRITYTSGTTGRPKGAVHTWDRLWRLAHPLNLLRLKPRVMRTVLFPFPLCYYTGVLVVVTTLLAGGKIVLQKRFNPGEMLRSMPRERVSLVSGSPTMFRLLLSTPGQENADFSSVRRVYLGTEICPPDLAQALHERFLCPLENVYATNETGNISWTGLRDSWEKTAKTVGKPLPGVQVQIVDRERKSLPVGAIGQVAVRGGQIMLGYYRDPELTARVLDPDGWFYTGDLGFLGEDGYLRLVGRGDDAITRGGQHIYPEEVETYLERHPAVWRAGVIGVDDLLGGESVWTYLQLYPGASLTSGEVLDFCRGQIAPFKIPDQVRFIERLPTTASGKVQRFRLREWAREELVE
jgi:fatty-acyl-CoA synthase